MNIKRNLRFGNTEEMFQFCPEEILYMQAVSGEEETTVFLVNRDYYFLPNGLGYVSKVIDDTLLRSGRTNNSVCRIGRSTIINLDYLNVIENNTICLVADINGLTTKGEVGVSSSACEKLEKLRALTKKQQKDYQIENFKVGYDEKTLGGGPGYTGFMVRTFEPRERPESYYDIGDDEIMFLGV
jgi:hypothetical protein